VPCFSGSCSEVYLEKAFDNTGLRPAERSPIAKELGETSLMFLVHPTLTQSEIDKTCQTLSNVLKEAV
jgi:dTDP-4-amino-4,6-dideoxygalactose transaminase